MPSPFEDAHIQNLYEVIGPLGRGGMGEVLRIRHRVWELDLAAKIPLASTMTSTGGFPQLRREAETWIRLPSHPNVVTCHYVRTFAGTPVIFIEFVEGGSLAQDIANGSFKHGATTPTLVTRALSITLDVAHGLAHAHEAGVVHQDIKPSNVLLDEQGAKITDFGIAALGKVPETTAEMPEIRGPGTMLATVVGMTPLYASPEQLETSQKKNVSTRDPITRATDIWSLGLTLVEMLTGKTSWQAGRADHVLDKPNESWRDLETLLRRMLHKEPAKRPKATEVVAELSRLLEIRGVVRAAPRAAEMQANALNNRAISLLDLDLREEARQNLQNAMAIDPCHPEAVFNDSLLAWRSGQMTDLGALDRVRQAISTHDGWEAKLLEAWIHIERGDEKAAWKVLDRVAEYAAGAVRGTRAVARASRAVRDSIREISSFRAAPGIADALAISHDEKSVVVGDRNGQVSIFDLATGKCFQRFQAHGEYVFGVALSRDGRRVYSTGWDGIFAAHDRETQKSIFRKKHPGKISKLVLSPDEKQAFCGNHSGLLRAWALTKRSAKKILDVLNLENDASILCAAFTPDGNTLIVGGENNELYWIDPTSRTIRQSVKLWSHPQSLAFARVEDGRDILLVGRQNQQVTLHDLATGQEIGALRDLQSWVSQLAVSPNGQWAVCSNGLHWTLWNLLERRCIRTFEAPALITGAIFLANGELVTLDWQGFVRRYTLEKPSPAPMMIALPHRARELAAGRVAVDAALQQAIAALEAGQLPKAITSARQAREAKGFERAPDVLEVWERIGKKARRSGIRAVWPRDQWGPAKASSRLAFDPSRQWLASANDEGSVTLWNLQSSEIPARIQNFEFPSEELASRAMAFSTNGAFLAVGSYKHLHIFNLATGEKNTTTEPCGYVRAVAFGGPDGRFVAALDDHGHAQVFTTNDLRRVATVRGPENWVNALAFVDDQHFLTGDYNGHLLLWDIDAAAKTGFLPGEWNSSSDRKPTPAAAFVRDFNRYAVAGSQSISAIAIRNDNLYFGCADKALHVVDLKSSQTKMKLSGHGSNVSCFDFLDDQYVVTGSFDKLVRIFDLRSGQCVSTIEGHTHTIWDVVALGPSQFLTASDDDQIRRFHIDWDLEP